MRLSASSGSDTVITVSRERNLPVRSITARIARSGRISRANVTRRSFTSSMVEGRPRERRMIAPSLIHPSPMSCSTMIDIVLGCNPENRAISTRDTGCLNLISSNTISRLISRAFSLDASCTEERSIRLTPRTLSGPCIFVAAEADSFVVIGLILRPRTNVCIAIVPSLKATFSELRH